MLVPFLVKRLLGYSHFQLLVMFMLQILQIQAAIGSWKFTLVSVN
jgi:hypothetical protein